MIACLDTSVAAALVLDDVHHDRTLNWLSSGPDVTLSEWTVTEFSSALSGHERLGAMTRQERLASEARFDQWIEGRSVERLEAEDFAIAKRVLRENIRLRGPDSLHLAFALSRGYALATFDQTLAHIAGLNGVMIVGFDKHA